MINCRVKRICCEDVSLIENYDKAIADMSRSWHLHHRLEIELNKTRKELIEMGLYYHRPASELIFLTIEEHLSIHHKGKEISKEQREKTSKKLIGGHLSEEAKKKISEANKGKNNAMYGKNAYANKSDNEMKMISNKISMNLKQYYANSQKYYKWITPEKEIKIMSIRCAHRYHPDWILVEGEC